MAILEIPSGTTIATPSVMSISINDIIGKEVSASGLMLVDIIASKRKLAMKWSTITNAALATLLTNTATPGFTVKYFDPLDNALKTITAYREGANVGTLMVTSGTPTWRDVSMTLSEQ